MFTSNPDLKSWMAIEQQPASGLSDNKTVKLLSPMDDSSLEHRRNFSEIDPPMRLEFLRDGEPSRDSLPVQEPSSDQTKTSKADLTDLNVDKAIKIG